MYVPSPSLRVQQLNLPLRSHSLFQVCKSPDRVRKWKEALSSEEFVASQRPQLERVTSGFDSGPDSDLAAPISDGFDPDLLDPEPLFALAFQPKPNDQSPPRSGSSPKEPEKSQSPPRSDDSNNEKKSAVIDLDTDSDDDDLPIVIEELSTSRMAPPLRPSSAFAPLAAAGPSLRAKEPLVEGDGNADAGPIWKKQRLEQAPPSLMPPSRSSIAAPSSGKGQSSTSTSTRFARVRI